MPDLSNLLGAVYGDGPSSTDRDPEDEAHVEQEPAADERGPAVPDWADDDHLDAAFAQWKPGPAPDASPAEHAFATDADDDAPPPLADDLAAALSEALVAVAGGVEETIDPVTGHEPPKRFDFSVQDEVDDPTEEAEPPQVFAPLNLSKSENDSDDRAETAQPLELGEVGAPEPAVQDWHEPEPEVEAEAEPDHELDLEPIDVGHVHETAAAEVNNAVEAVEDDHTAVVDEHDEVEETRRPSMTTPREAAAELTATSRAVAEPAVAEPAPEPESEPVAAVPVPVPPEPTRVPFATDGPSAATTLPTGTRRWDRSDDDILPEKQAKKFFSFSLRRG